MLSTHGRTVGAVIGTLLTTGLLGCGTAKQTDHRDAGKARAEAKRQQTACASSAAYDRLKGIVFDRAIAKHGGDPANLNTLADYSVARMESPVVHGWDPALEITRCDGEFVLELAPGAERGFGGERRLRAKVEYAAQAAADGNGMVYTLQGADAIVDRLAAFNLTSVAYRPPPAIDSDQSLQDAVEPAAVAENDGRVAPPREEARPAARTRVRQEEPVREASVTPSIVPKDRIVTAREPVSRPVSNASDEAVVRSFYGALGAGDGGTASSYVVPEKRGGAYSPAAMSRFYAGLPEPLRLTGIGPGEGGTYRVSYRYSAGRSRCNGWAIVRVTQRNGRNFIRSIRALDGC